MYRQMRHTDLVARDPASFIDLAVRLAGEDGRFRESQSRAIREKYSDMHRNHQAAGEWLEFLDRAVNRS
jgi:hypothetical protein